MRASATAVALIIGIIGGGAYGTLTSTGPVPVDGARVVGAEQVRSNPSGVRWGEPSLAKWARTRFSSAGLVLPPVRISIHATKEPCNGNTGLSIHGGSVESVELCPAPDAGEVVAKRAVLHELAHVWARSALTDEQREAFAAYRNCPSWSGGRWAERGSEHAAEIIAWTLMDRELTMITIPDHEPGQLAEAYRFLTGMEPPFRQG